MVFNIIRTFIFIAGYDHYALEAFKKDAIDYIVKPFNSNTPEKVIDIALSYIIVPAYMNKFNLHKRLLINTANELHALKYADIIRFEADGNYTKIITVEGEILLTSKTLKDYEAIFSKKRMFCESS